MQGRGLLPKHLGVFETLPICLGSQVTCRIEQKVAPAQPTGSPPSHLIKAEIMIRIARLVHIT